jgi:hypothetical protein
MTVVAVDDAFHVPLKLQGNRYIFNGPTDITDEVIVGLPVCFIDVGTASKAETVYQALLDENIEIAIYVPQAQGGELCFQLVTDEMCRQMVSAGLEEVIDAITLFALANLCCHRENIVNATYAVNN